MQLSVLAPLDHAERLFNEQSKDKAYILDRLNTAWGSLVEISKNQPNGLIPVELEQAAARIYHLYGRSLYGGDMQASANMFEVALAFQIKTALKIEQFAIENFSTILTGNVRNEAYGAQAAKLLINGDVTSVVAELNDESSLLAGRTMRWMGHAFQNISAVAVPSNVEFFERVYGVCQKVLENSGHKDANWEVAELLYNTTRFIHGLKVPGDSLGGLRTLEKLAPFLEKEGLTPRAQKLRAQILNIQMVVYSRIKSENPQELLKTQYELVSKAVAIADATEGFDQFLKHMFYNNKARLAMDCLEAKVDFEVIDIGGLIDTVVSYMEANGYDHYYHAIFLQTAARFGEGQKAVEYLNKALSVCQKFQDSTDDIEIDVRAKLAKLV